MGWLVAGILFSFFYTLQTAIILWAEKPRPAKMAAWLVIAYAAPLIGFVFWLLAGRAGNSLSRTSNRVGFDTALRRSRSAISPSATGNKQFDEEEKLSRLLNATIRQPLTFGNDTVVLTNGKAYFGALLQAIDEAEHHIHFDYYTFRDDDIGGKITARLADKVAAGVEVRVLFDRVGSIGLRRRAVRKLKEKGIQAYSFLPPGATFGRRWLNNRNHSKIAVIDGRTAFVGGMNIGDEYLGKDRRLGFWRDTQLKLKGDAVYWIQELFLKDWELASEEKLIPDTYMPDRDSEPDVDSGEAVWIVSSGPDEPGKPILTAALGAIGAAKTSICMSTPYFIPDESLLAAICTAARSGIDVRLIIPGTADTQLVLWATLSYVERLLEAGVQVYRYQKGFIHAKVLLVDRMIASVGTANMDMRSLHSNFEQNALLFGESTIDRLYRDFEQDVKDSVQLKLESFKERSGRQKRKEAFARLLSPLL
ncbi:cardiolipin synthase [Paenibacillus sp. NPDC058071]|uniref:cardiolipin synthase n=1 Tax=Paenibacillus sp. NPDC058071 TaxID=3346326 RepID=UPI0036D9AE55